MPPITQKDSRGQVTYMVGVVITYYEKNFG